MQKVTHAEVTGFLESILANITDPTSRVNLGVLNLDCNDRVFLVTYTMGFVSVHNWLDPEVQVTGPGYKYLLDH